jgi:hypothetical protein
VIRTNTTPNTPRALEPIGEPEMKTVAGGEVGAVMSAIRDYCTSQGYDCTFEGAIDATSNYYYGGGTRSRPNTAMRY